MCSRAQSLRAAASAEQDRLRAQWQLEMEIREKRALQVWAGVGVGVGGGTPSTRGCGRARGKQPAVPVLPPPPARPCALRLHTRCSCAREQRSVGAVSACGLGRGSWGLWCVAQTTMELERRLEDAMAALKHERGEAARERQLRVDAAEVAEDGQVCARDLLSPTCSVRPQTSPPPPLFTLFPFPP